MELNLRKQHDLTSGHDTAFLASCSPFYSDCPFSQIVGIGTIGFSAMIGWRAFENGGKSLKFLQNGRNKRGYIGSGEQRPFPTHCRAVIIMNGSSVPSPSVPAQLESSTPEAPQQPGCFFRNCITTHFSGVLI